MKCIYYWLALHYSSQTLKLYAEKKLVFNRINNYLFGQYFCTAEKNIVRLPDIVVMSHSHRAITVLCKIGRISVGLGHC